MSSLQDTDDDEVQSCQNNPGHEAFLDLETCLNLGEEFIQRLPTSYRRNAVLIKDLIQCLADLTVKIESCYLQGTGFIFNVTFSTHDGTLDKCNCVKCRKLDHPNCVKGELYVRTNDNVIIKEENDTLENTQCILFYNSKVEIGVNVVAVRVDRRIYNDYVCIVCFTCELDILTELIDTLDRFNNIKLELSSKYVTKRESKDCYVIILSHPHGIHKHVTIGPFVPTEMKSLTEYKADTCIGVRGSYVFVLGGPEDAGSLIHIGDRSNAEENFNSGNSYKYLNTFKSEGFFQHIYSCCKKIVTELFYGYDSNIL